MRRLRFFWQYLFKPPWDTGLPASALVRVLEQRASAQRPPGKALDVGCGTGTNVHCLARAGWRVTGVDFAPNAIVEARRKNGVWVERVTLWVGDVTKLASLPLPGPYELALDVGCLHGMPREQWLDYVAGLRHWLVPGALYLLYAMQPRSLTGGPGLTRTDVENLFRADFRLVNYEGGAGQAAAWYYLEKKGD